MGGTFVFSENTVTSESIFHILVFKEGLGISFSLFPFGENIKEMSTQLSWKNHTCLFSTAVVSNMIKVTIEWIYFQGR